MTERTTSLETPPGYIIQDAESLRALIAGLPARAHLGGDPEAWSIDEVGDGNLNLVFLVHGPDGGLALKQALPYVRLVGESWPLPLSRAHYEHMALSEQARHAPGLVPEIVHYDETLAFIAMELLSPHIIMRHGMIAGTIYPKFSDDLSTFMAGTLFSTSSLALDAARKKSLIGAFSGNTALCKITEDLVFTEPYIEAENNRWTTPYLDAIAAEFRGDSDLKLAVSRLKLKFMDAPEALLHGDLHTGSIMLTTDDTRVIDPEFAFMGPMGFDVGALVANLLLNYFSQVGHEESPGARDDYRAWILHTVEDVWRKFRAKFLALWAAEGIGDGYLASLFSDAHGALAMAREREAYMDRLFADTVGFAAAKMIRRILGLAHNIDLEWIEDTQARATAEIRALRMARSMMVHPTDYGSIEALTQGAERYNRMVPDFGQSTTGDRE